MSDEYINSKHDTAKVEGLHRYQTAESVLLPIPRDAFEKLYLSPKTPTAGNLRRTFGNPTPISLMGFLISATPTAMLTMGWGGSGGNGGAILPAYIFFGGMVQIFGAVGEWILGNTFSSALFFTYGTFWIVQGTSQIPWYGIGTNYSPTGDSFEGMQTPEFAATTGLYYATLSVLTFVFVICSIRTNVCLFLALLLLVIAFALFAATYFQMSVGNPAHAATLEKAAGGVTFVLCLPIWWIFIAQIFEAVDLPLTIPVGDLSTVVLGKTQKAKRREA